MISPEQAGEILRLHHAEKWPINTIAKHLGLHWETVKNTIQRGGVPTSKRDRHRELEDFLPFLLEKLEEHPGIRATRLYDMCRERGYSGGLDHFRHLIAEHRPRPQAEAYLRLSSICAEQAQVDWGYFGKVKVGNAERRLMGFVMVLSWSRQIFLRFFLNDRMESFLRGHIDAFEDWGGVPRVILYDNLKSAVLGRRGLAIQFNPNLIALSSHYRFEVRAAAPYRGNEKGKVERAIRYVRDRFFAARELHDIDQLNREAREWCYGIAASRPWKDGDVKTVGEAFLEEKTRLRRLPGTRFPGEERREVKAGKTPYVRFDLNDYSIPHDRTRRILSVWATHSRLRITDGIEVIAEHPRSFSRGEVIEQGEHIRALREQKRQARKHSGIDRLAAAAPSTKELFDIQAERSMNIGSLTAQLLRVLDIYGSRDFEAAVQEAIDRGVYHAQGIAQILDRMRSQRGQPAPIPIKLADEKLRNLQVRVHDLGAYDALGDFESDENDNDEREA